MAKNNLFTHPNKKEPNSTAATESQVNIFVYYVIV